MTESHPTVEMEVQHYRGVLRQAIRAAGFSVSEVERRLGAGPKALRRVFGGSVDLKFKHVVSVLRIIGMSPEQFFAIASRAPRRRQRSAGAELLATFERIGYRGDFVPIADDAEMPSDEDFDRMVEEAVLRVMKRRAEEGKLAARAEPRPSDRDKAEAAGAAEPE
jgi:hypothetical protein